MRKISVLILAALLILSACAAPGTDGAHSQWQYTFTDSTGATVSLQQKPDTVAVLFSSYAEIWTLAGGTVAVTVGESVERGFAAADTPLVDGGAGKTIDHELLLAAQPDFIIGSADIAAQVEACQVMSQNGIACALFRVDTFQDYLNMLSICTDITGDAGAYEKNGNAVAQQVEQLLAETAALGAPPKHILFIRAGSQYSSTKAKRAPDNFVCIMLDELGCYNIADSAAVLLDGLSVEEILLQDPDYIFLVPMGSEDAAKSYIRDLFAQAGWRQLKAVAQGQYAFLDKDLFHFKPNARWGDAYRHLAELLYPELNAHG